MNIFDYILLSVVLIGAFYVILYLHRRKKKGLSGCASCPDSASCLRSQAGSRLSAHSGLRHEEQTSACSAGQKNTDAHACCDKPAEAPKGR